MYPSSEGGENETPIYQDKDISWQAHIVQKLQEEARKQRFSANTSLKVHSLQGVVNLKTMVPI